MGRKARDPLEITPDSALDTGALDAARHQLAERMQVVLAQFGDGLPYDQERVIHEAQFYMAQSAEAMLQVGRRLVVLKEHTPHGDFQNIVEQRLGLATQTARKMMQAAIKFSNPALSKRSTSSVLIEAAGSKSKLFELMLLDDEQLEELNEGGTVAGLDLDDVERMSVSELRRALREAKENYKAQGEVLADKNAKIDRVAADMRKLKRKVAETPPDEIGRQLLQEVSGYAFAAEAAVRGDLRRGVEALVEHHAMGEATDCRPAIAGFLLQVERALNDLYAEHDIPRELVSTAMPALGLGQD